MKLKEYKDIDACYIAGNKSLKDGIYKVGHSKNLSQRLETLSKDYPTPFIPLFIFENGEMGTYRDCYCTEYQIHNYDDRRHIIDSVRGCSNEFMKLSDGTLMQIVKQHLDKLCYCDEYFDNKVSHLFDKVVLKILMLFTSVKFDVDKLSHEDIIRAYNFMKKFPDDSDPNDSLSLIWRHVLLDDCELECD